MPYSHFNYGVLKSLQIRHSFIFILSNINHQFISSLGNIHHIYNIQVMVLEKTQGLLLTSSKPIVQCLDSISYNHLNSIELLKYKQVSHMMRTCNKRHRQWYRKMKPGVVTYSDGGCSTCQWQNLDTSHVGRWLKI